ncbi:MAG: polysaccharide deacetylase family protein [Micromonosporaceae bacterium]
MFTAPEDGHFRRPSSRTFLRKTCVTVACLTTALFGLAALPAAARQASQAAVAAVPANQAAKAAVALAFDANGNGFAFYRGESDAVYMRTFFGDQPWSGQAGIGGTIVGAPAAAVARTSTLLVAARGSDNALWVRARTNGTWGSWASWGGNLSASPAIIGASDGRIDVYARGTDNALWTRTMSSTGVLTAWRSLGGRLTTAPAAADFGGITVYAAGTDHAVWKTSPSANGTWSWKSIGGRTYSAPAPAFIPQSNGGFVLARGTNNALWANGFAAGTSTGWKSLGGTVIDSPAAAGTGLPMPHFVVTVRQADNAVWTTVYGNEDAWSGTFTRAWAPAAPSPPASSLLGKDWTRIPTTSKVVALTFDAGGDADGLASIESTLRTKKVKATFFFTGNWVRDYPAQANLIAQGGFLIGNHSMTHPDLTGLTDDQVSAQVQNAQQAVLTASGADPRPIFRFPFGAVNSRVLGDVGGLGYVAVSWTVDSLGWQGTSGGQTVQKVIDRVLGAAQPGEIVLMHVGSNPDDNTTLDASALPKIIDGLRARGYTFVTLRALTG